MTRAVGGVVSVLYVACSSLIVLGDQCIGNLIPDLQLGQVCNPRLVRHRALSKQ